jgi:hypothetical protein
MAHVLEKGGGEANIVEQVSGWKIRMGLFLLVVSAIFTGGALLAGRVGFWGGGTMVGALLLYRGWRQRRRKTLDEATRGDLLRRA